MSDIPPEAILEWSVPVHFSKDECRKISTTVYGSTFITVQQTEQCVVIVRPGLFFESKLVNVEDYFGSFDVPMYSYSVFDHAICGDLGCIFVAYKKDEAFLEDISPRWFFKCFIFDIVTIKLIRSERYLSSDSYDLIVCNHSSNLFNPVSEDLFRTCTSSHIEPKRGIWQIFSTNDSFLLYGINMDFDNPSCCFFRSDTLTSAELGLGGELSCSGEIVPSFHISQSKSASHEKIAWTLLEANNLPDTLQPWNEYMQKRYRIVVSNKIDGVNRIIDSRAIFTGQQNLAIVFNAMTDLTMRLLKVSSCGQRAFFLVGNYMLEIDAEEHRTRRVAKIGTDSPEYAEMNGEWFAFVIHGNLSLYHYGSCNSILICTLSPYVSNNPFFSLFVSEGCIGYSVTDEQDCVKFYHYQVVLSSGSFPLGSTIDLFLQNLTPEKYQSMALFYTYSNPHFYPPFFQFFIPHLPFLPFFLLHSPFSPCFFSFFFFFFLTPPFTSSFSLLTSSPLFHSLLSFSFFFVSFLAFFFVFFLFIEMVRQFCFGTEKDRNWTLDNLKLKPAYSDSFDKRELTQRLENLVEDYPSFHLDSPPRKRRVRFTFTPEQEEEQLRIKKPLGHRVTRSGRVSRRPCR